MQLAKLQRCFMPTETESFKSKGLKNRKDQAKGSIDNRRMNHKVKTWSHSHLVVSSGGQLNTDRQVNPAQPNPFYCVIPRN